MAAYQVFTSARTTEPDAASLLANLRALDASAGVHHTAGPLYTIKKATDWTVPQISAAQSVIDAAPASSPQLAAQAWVDVMPLGQKAFILTLLDQINLIRSKLSPPLGAITPGQVLQAVRDKAGTL